MHDSQLHERTHVVVRNRKAGWSLRIQFCADKPLTAMPEIVLEAMENGGWQASGGPLSQWACHQHKCMCNIIGPAASCSEQDSSLRVALSGAAKEPTNLRKVVHIHCDLPNDPNSLESH